MDSLANEILREIFSYLCASDLDSVRLVSRRFSATANIFKFRTLHVRISRKGLNNLLNISRQPELARCVRQITYPFCRLPMVQSAYFDEEHGAGRVVTPPQLGDMGIFSKMFFDWYTANYIAQFQLEESGESVQILQDALSKMPNIKVIISGYYDVDNFDIGQLKIWLGSISDDDRRYVELWGDDYEWGVLHPIEEGEERALKTTMDLINTTHRLGYNLDRFEFNISRYWLRSGIFYNDSKLWGCAALFENLTCLLVCITTLESYENDADFMETAKEGQFSKFLSFAPNLKELSLEVESRVVPSLFTGPDFKSPSIFLLDVLGRDNVWKHLHTFHLKFPSMVLAEIVEFLGRHARTLTCLHLEIHMVLNGTWRELLDFLNERLHLTDFEILLPFEIRIDERPHLRRYKFDAQRRMKNYVLNEGAPFPPTKQELEENGWDMRMFLDYWEDESEEEEEGEGEEGEEEGDDEYEQVEEEDVQGD
ncbi:hypothetical protein RUND412_000419 [Rhizina undulata]